jgi:multimeric flavodoxin WrbA
MVKMILGIGGSGRPNGVTNEAVKAILEASGTDYEYVCLSGKNIGACIGCTACASDNRCKVKDDWIEIGEKMLKADAIIFGAPNYYNNINALGHACLERTFCFRHRDAYRLAGKLGVIVSTGYKSAEDVVGKFIERVMISNKMAIVGKVRVDGYSQCYTCGYGTECMVGNVIKDHGFIDEIKAEHLPPDFNCQETAKLEAYKMGKLLGSIVVNKNKINS